MPRSRYQLRGVGMRRSQARGFKVKGASPGETPKHFWVPLYATSTPPAVDGYGLSHRGKSRSPPGGGRRPFPAATAARVVAHAGAGLGVDQGYDLGARVGGQEGGRLRGAAPRARRRAPRWLRKREATSHIRSPNRAVDADHHHVARAHGVYEGGFHAGRPGARHRQGERVLRRPPRCGAGRTSSSRIEMNSGSRWPSMGPGPVRPWPPGRGCTGPGPSRSDRSQPWPRW